MKEVEVSIKGLLFYIIKHWKSVVIAMFIGAVAISGLQMLRIARNNQSDPITMEVGENLTNSERTYVESVYEYLNGLRAVNERQSESILMNMDPSKLIKTELTYMISVEDSMRMEGIEQAFISFLGGSEFIGYISDMTDIDDSDIADTVTVSHVRGRDAASNTVIKISVTSKEKNDADKIARIVDSYMFEKSNELLECGLLHELTKIGDDTSQGSDFSILERQVQYLEAIEVRNKAILDIENTIKGEQKEYYESLINGLELEEVYSENAVPAIEVPVRISLKYCLLGMLVGAAFMCGIYFLIYIFANKLDVYDDAEGLFGTYLIGTVTGKAYGKAIYKLQHLGKRSFDFDESIKIISTKIKMTAKKEGISTIGIIGCGIQKHNAKAANEIASKLKTDGIEVVLIDEPIYDPSSAEKLNEVESVILLEKAGVTYRSEIYKEIEMIKKLGIKADGLIIAE